jgi:hypothetical protein
MARVARTDGLLLAEALATLALASLAIKLLPFRRVAAMAGGAGRPASPPQGEAEAKKVRWAVHAWGRRVPWRVVCFQRGLAAHLMLRRRGLPSLLHYGAAAAAEGELSAHVWVTLEGKDIMGGEEASKFALLATFPGAGGDGKGG